MCTKLVKLGRSNYSMAELLLIQQEQHVFFFLGEPINFIGITHRNMGKGLSAGGKVTPRQLQYQQASPAWVTDHKTWKPGGHCTASRQLSRSESDLSRWFHWSLFQAVPLVSASAGQRGSSGSGCLQSLLFACS